MPVQSFDIAPRVTDLSPREPFFRFRRRLLRNTASARLEGSQPFRGKRKRLKRSRCSNSPGAPFGWYQGRPTIRPPPGGNANLMLENKRRPVLLLRANFLVLCVSDSESLVRSAAARSHSALHERRQVDYALRLRSLSYGGRSRLIHPTISSI
jgi:hypothetical protein